MRRLWAAMALAGTGFFTAGVAQAEPVKIAIVETLSGGQAAVGKMFLTAINYGLIKVNDEKAWPDGVKILEYDNQGGPSEASDKVKAAINDGAHIIIQGASSAIGGQITDDVRKHNLRNPGKEIIYLNVRGGHGVHRVQVSLLSLPLERQRGDPAARVADGHEGCQDLGHPRLRDRPELQLGPRRRAPR